MPTENRYLTLHKEEMARDGFQTVNKRKRFNTGHSEENACETRDLFVRSSTEDKLNIMFEEILCIRGIQEETNKGMLTFQNGFKFMNEKMAQIVEVSNRNTNTLKTLAYKSIDIEARSRRNNLIFWGFVENYNENCFTIIRDFISQRLDLNADTMYLARAHRLGPRRRDYQNQRRPIIVNFRDFCDVQAVMNRAYMLKNSPFSIDLDMPREITAARKRLWSELKTIKSQNPRVKYQIVYPAKLIVDGKLIRDEFPDWNQTINTSRLADFSHIDNMCAGQSNIENMCGVEQPVWPSQNTNRSLRTTQMCDSTLNTKDKIVINERNESCDQSMDEDSHSTTSSISYSTQDLAAGPSQQNVNTVVTEDTEYSRNNLNTSQPFPQNEYSNKQSTGGESTNKQDNIESSLSQSNSVLATLSVSQCDNTNVQPFFRPFNVNSSETECPEPEISTENIQDKCLPDKLSSRNSSRESLSSRGHVSRSKQRDGTRRACSLSVPRSDELLETGNQAAKNPVSDKNRQLESKNSKSAREKEINKQVSRESGSHGSKNRSTTDNTDTNKQGDGQGP